MVPHRNCYLGFDFKSLFTSKLLYKDDLAEAARGDSASSRKRASTNVALCLPCRGVLLRLRFRSQGAASALKIPSSCHFEPKRFIVVSVSVRFKKAFLEIVPTAPSRV